MTLKNPQTEGSELVSAIIPTHNCGPWIEEAIDSVDEQTYPHIEIVIVDDGSTDETRDILKPYIDRNMVRYFYQKNQGPGAARNRGVQESKGNYVAFLDADDLWVREKIEKQMDSIVTNPEIKMVLSNSYSINETGKVVGRNSNEISVDNKKLLKQLFFGEILNFTSTILVEKEPFLSVGGFDEELSKREDHLFIMEMIDRYDFTYMHSFLAKKRERPESTGKVSSEEPKELLDAYMPFIDTAVKRFPELSEEKSKALGLIERKVAMNYYKINDRKKTFIFAKRAFSKLGISKVSLGPLFLLLLVLSPIPHSFGLRLKRLLAAMVKTGT